MIREFSKQQLAQLKNELEKEKLKDSSSAIKFIASIQWIKASLNNLRAWIKDHPFPNEEEEIHFFKTIKPSFYALQIFHTELFNLESHLPADQTKEINYLEQELKYLDHFFQHHQVLYQYYRLQATDLDNIYFLRKKVIESPLLPTLPDLDPEFSTAGDYLFAKIMAFEDLQRWILDKLAYLKQDATTSYQHLKHQDQEELYWTGDTINLVEMGFAIYHTGQLNGGAASINMIFKWLEQKFKVKIGVPAKRFAEIRRRKRLSQTRFIDEMKDSLLKKLDKEDEFIPHH